MRTVAISTPVGRLVVERPARAEVFERFGIDYCCQGRLPLDEACERHGVSTAAVLVALAAADAEPPDPTECDARSMDTAALIDRVVAVHHDFLWRELAPLGALAQRVAAAHCTEHPELVRLARAYECFREDMEVHMRKEEDVLFPALRELSSGRALPSLLQGDLHLPLLAMEGDHECAEQSLRYFRKVTGGYLPPADACDAWRALLERLRRLERDLHRHVHLENEILHARARALTRR
jgi:regulator of cell morphogenesis and NO signaling